MSLLESTQGMDDIKMDNSFSFFLYFQRWRRRNQKRKKHLWGSSSVIATGGFSSTDFRFQEKIYIINGVSMTHTHTREWRWWGNEEKKNQFILIVFVISPDFIERAPKRCFKLPFKHRLQQTRGILLHPKDYNKHKKNT